MAPKPLSVEEVKKNAFKPKTIFQGCLLGFFVYLLTPSASDVAEHKPFARELGETKVDVDHTRVHAHTHTYTHTHTL
jgi:hypothetical protein